jgi:predicted lipoprotein
VATDEQCEFASQLLREIKAKWHVLEEQRTKITGPMNQSLRATNEFFRPATRSLEHGEGILKLKIVAYLQTKSQANTRALQAAAVAATPELAQQAIQTVAPVAPPQGVSVRHVWKFEVTDANQVPRELCSPDEKKIKAAFELGMTDIPGVKFYQEAVVSARSG